MFAKDSASYQGLRCRATAAIAFSLFGLTSAVTAQSSMPPIPTYVRSDLFLPSATTFNQIQVATSLDQILNHGVTATPLGSLTVVPVVLPQDDLPIFVTQQVRLSFPKPSDFLERADLVQLALDQLAPNLYTDLPYLVFNNTQIVYGSLEQRMEELRFGAILPPSQPEPAVTGTSKDGKEIKEPVAPAPPPSQPKWGTFAYLNGTFGRLDSDSNGFGFDYQGGGAVVGADYRITDKLAVGIAGAYEYANLDPKYVVGGHGSANAGYGALYTTYGGPTGLYAEAIGGVGYTAFAVQRDVLGTSAHGYPSAWDASVGGTLGYMIKLTNNLGFAPFGQLFYDNLWRSGTSETGSIASLSISHGSAETLDTVVGGKFAGSFYLGSVRITNLLWAGYRHDYLQSIYSVSSSFIDGGIGSFVTQSPHISADSLVAGAGVNADLTARFSVSVNYSIEANQDYLGNLFTLGLKYKF
jgi:fibronectin-binding autotransporter adhesin